jgi:tRNA1Val (adenine37-N6)-methyltransferase
VKTTRDTLFGGRVVLRQPARKAGYRVNVDAILLAAFAAGALDRKIRRARAAVDLGAGVGAVGLALLHLGGAEGVTMVEIDPSLADLARENAATNGWSERVIVRNRDVAEVTTLESGAADLVVCNPPYVAAGRGRAPSAHRRGAKWSGRGGGGALADFVDAARRLVGRRARVCFVYPASEATMLIEALRARALEPKRLCAVHAKPDEQARIVMVEALPAKPGGLVIEAPVVETDGKGRRTPLVQALLDRERAGAPLPTRDP